MDREVCKVPGATKYNNNIRPVSGKAPIYSMRQKTKVHDKSMTIDAQTTTPGPGNYENPEIDMNRSSFSSKFQRLSFSPGKSGRFNSFSIAFHN